MNALQGVTVDQIDSLFGFFNGYCAQWFCLGSIFAVLALGYYGASLLLWTITIGVILVGWGAPIWALTFFLALAVVFNTPIRKVFISSVVLKVFNKLGLIPKISETERTALEAGVVWIEGELFSGNPNFKKILKEPYPQLSEKRKKGCG